MHGIHSASMRSSPFEFVRDRGTSGIYSYDWSEVTYPNVDGNCLSCHAANTYRVAVSADALPSTDRVTSSTGTESRARVLAARAGVPNDTDLVTSPQAASCTGCHDGPLSLAHMDQNGGSVGMPRIDYEVEARVETCNLCHGPGRIADVELVHPLLR